MLGWRRYNRPSLTEKGPFRRLQNSGPHARGRQHTGAGPRRRSSAHQPSKGAETPSAQLPSTDTPFSGWTPRKVAPADEFGRTRKHFGQADFEMRWGQNEFHGPVCRHVSAQKRRARAAGRGGPAQPERRVL